MKKVLFVGGVVLSIFFSSVAAQTSSQDREPSLGYLFGGLGAITCGECDTTGVYHLGGGAEAFFAGGLGVGAELGLLGGLKESGSELGVLSVGPVYAFKPGKKNVPFLTGGYTMIFRSGVANGIYFGGGVDHWASDRFGVRFEGRDQVILEGETAHILEVRVGLIIR